MSAPVGTGIDWAAQYGDVVRLIRACPQFQLEVEYSGDEVEDVLQAWQVGSIEIVYSGRGVARLFGAGRQFVADPLVEVEVLPLEHAGADIFRGLPDPATAPTRRYLPR